MVKGVNKQIIEISDTGNDYFDRAILFVRPAKLLGDLAGEEKLRRKGQEYLWALQLRPWMLLNGSSASTAFKIGLGALLGGGATALFFFIR